MHEAFIVDRPSVKMANTSVVLCTAGYDHTIKFWQAPQAVCYRNVQFADSVFFLFF